MDIKEIVIFNIIKYCKIKNISTEELSLKLDKDKEFIDSLAKGKRKNELTLYLVYKISEIMGMSIILLFDGIDKGA